jgi:Putative porin
MTKQRSLFRSVAVSVLLLGVFAITPALTFSGESPAKAPGDAAPPSATKSNAPEANVATPAAIKALEGKVSEQQAQIEKLTRAVELLSQRLNETSQASAVEAPHPASVGQVSSLTPVIPASAATASSGSPDALAAPAGGAPATAAQVANVESELKDTQKTVDGVKKQLGNFNFSGDVRVRLETFRQEGSQARNRERIRARLNIRGKISDDIYGGVTVASGSLDDPISTNQTLTTFYTRKPVAIDQAFVTVNPHNFKALSVTAGKMAYPWYRTELTFDNDLNPEGLSESLSFNFKKSALRNVKLIGYQMTFNESGGGPDSWMYGGQLQLNFKPSEKSSAGLYVSGLNFINANPIAVAQGNASLANSLTNTVVRDINGNVTGYGTKFAYFELAGRAGYKLTDRWPLDAGLDFVDNTRAASGQRSGYLAEVNLGRTSNPKDYKFGYLYYHIEKDAVISAFNFSDLRTATNVENHGFLFSYQLMKNVTSQWTYLLGKKLNDSTDHWLNRMQFDMIYKF